MTKVELIMILLTLTSVLIGLIGLIVMIVIAVIAYKEKAVPTHYLILYLKISTGTFKPSGLWDKLTVFLY